MRKRLTKTPKLYFYGTGLLCYLLRIRTLSQLLTSPYLGPVFENLVIEEQVKAHLNAGEEPDLYFYRDDSKIEVDLVDLTTPGKELLAEMKSSQTYRSGFSRHVRSVGEEIAIPPERRFVVERAEGNFVADGVQVRSAATWLGADGGLPELGKPLVLTPRDGSCLVEIRTLVTRKVNNSKCSRRQRWWPSPQSAHRQGPSPSARPHT